MALTHAKSGDVVQIGAGAGDAASTTLIRDTHIEVFQLALKAGAHLQEHRAAGAMTMQCLSGSVLCHCHGEERRMLPGSLLFLQDAEPHAVTCEADALLLITLVLHRK